MTEQWTTLPGWIAAIEQGRLLSQVRPLPEGLSFRARAERAATTLCALALGQGSFAAQAFEGAARAA